MKKLLALTALALVPRIGMASDTTDLNRLNNSDIPSLTEDLIHSLPAPSPSVKIVGGTEAEKGEFPFIVSLQDRHGHFCGGSLIKKDWVLTAAHCVQEGVKTAVVGLHNQRQSKNTEKFSVDKVIPHPDFDKKPMDYDFALVHLAGESKHPPVTLNRSELSGSISLVTSGWGDTGEGFPKILRKVTLPLVPAKTCSTAYPGRITDRMLCAGFAEGGKDSCQGDSGGPLVLGSGLERTLVGVVIWGKGCGRPGKYGIYAKVSSVTSWIDSVAR